MLKPNVLSVPSKLFLGLNDSIEFIKDIYDYSYRFDVVHIDFSDTIEISESYALFLLAHIHKIQLDKRNVRCFRIICKNSPIYDSFFVNTGFLKSILSGSCVQGNQNTFSAYGSYTLNQLSKCRIRLNGLLQDALPTYLEYFSGKYSDEQIILFFESLSITISETLQNINHHAYDLKPDKIPLYFKFNSAYLNKLFWCFFWHNPLTHQLTFGVYDLGIGIIESYKNHSNRSRLDIERLNCMPKRLVMKEALSEGMSRFVGDGRGNGLYSVVSKNSELATITLSIQSNGVIYRRQMTESGFVTFEDIELNFPGTGIEWCFEMKK